MKTDEIQEKIDNFKEKEKPETTNKNDALNWNYGSESENEKKIQGMEIENQEKKPRIHLEPIEKSKELKNDKKQEKSIDSE